MQNQNQPTDRVHRPATMAYKKTQLQALAKIKRWGARHYQQPGEFLEWALPEAVAAAPECTLIFSELGQFARLHAAGERADPGLAADVIATIAQEARRGAMNGPRQLPAQACRRLEVADSLVLRLQTPDGAGAVLVALSGTAGRLGESSRVFVMALAQIIENVLQAIEIRRLNALVPSVLRAKRQWELTVDSLDRLVGLLDSHGRVLRVNRQVEAWSLGSVQSAAGKSMHALLHPDCDDPECRTRQALAGAWMQMLDDGDAGCGVELPGQLSETGYCQLRRTALHDADEAPAHTFAILTVHRYQQRESEASAEEAAASKLLAGQEGERRRIARELHDGIGHSLAVLKFSLEGLRREVNRSLDPNSLQGIDRIVAQLRDSMDEVHRLSTDLHPRYLESRSLPLALELLCEDLAAGHDRMVIDCRADNDIRDPDAEQKLAVFRIAQEALSNAVKHGRARQVFVELTQADGRLLLRVSDDGVGFDPERQAQSGRGHGLANMRERAAQTGGTLEILSVPDGGTVLSASWVASRDQDSAAEGPGDPAAPTRQRARR